ncbi:MAG: thermonuclease family protein [Caulobacter sp.]
MRDRRGPGPEAQHFFRTHRRRRALRNLLTQKNAGLAVAALVAIGLALNVPAFQDMFSISDEAATDALVIASPPAQPVLPGPDKAATAAHRGVGASTGSPVDASADAPEPWAAAGEQSLISGAAVRVVDGDTIELPNGERVRVLNIDTPEMAPRARCEREGALAQQAKARTQELVLTGELSFHASGRNRDRYGRLLRRIEVNGRDLGEQLVSEGLAQRWAGSKAQWC